MQINYRILRRRQVLAQIGKCTSSLYNDMHSGLWPPPVRLGAKSVGWPEHEVQTLLAAMIAGKGEDDRRALVARLVEARKKAAA